MVAAADMEEAGPELPASAGTGPAGGPLRHQLAELPEGFWYSVKRRVLGPPLVTEQLANERLSKPPAGSAAFRTRRPPSSPSTCATR